MKPDGDFIADARQPALAERAASPRVVIHANTEVPNSILRAKGLARETGLPLCALDDADSTADFVLRLMIERLELQETHARRAGPIFVDFARGPTARRGQAPAGRKQPLAKAAGLRGDQPLTVIDATAGLGRDAFQLASWGCKVIAVERSPVLWALVQDGLDRASRQSESLREIVYRIALIRGDSRELLARLCQECHPNVIYLDPMYPASAQSASVKKEMRICRSLVGDDLDASELCRMARKTGVRRVVVKRHRFAPPLDGPPSMTIRGTRVRFDVYLN